MDISLADREQSVVTQPITTTERLSVSDAVVRYLVEAGVRKVFGIPGGATIPFHASIEAEQEIDFVLTAHEGGASYMADCYARVSGKLAVCCATTGPGATNLLTGVASARQDSVPMLIITGMNPTDTWGRGDFQECSPYWRLDTVKMFDSVCKLSEVVVSEKVVLHRLRNAITKALAGRPGPVHLAIPRDLWTKKIRYEELNTATLVPHPPAPNQGAVREVITLLGAARRPLIIFGSGASVQAVEDLFAISDIYNIPIVSTPRAKGKYFGSALPYYLGSMGISATPTVDSLFEVTEFDIVLAVGAGFGSYATNSWDHAFVPTKSMIQVNIDADEIGRNYRADLGIVADAQVFTESLLRLVDELPVPDEVLERHSWIESWATKPRWTTTPADQAISQGVHPLEIVRSVDRAVGVDGLIMADSSSILLWATRYLPDREQRQFLSVWGWASMGHVTAGAIGAKLAKPEANVVVLTGDGCFLMNGNEVATAASLGLTIVWIVNVNTQLGMIHYELRDSQKTASATLGQHDFAECAKSLGARGVYCNDAKQLTCLIEEGLSQYGPTVIHVDVDPTPVPPMGNKKAGGRSWREYIAGI